MSRFYRDRFPHSEIPGSQVAKHLPEAYRSHATSFIAFRSQDILHLLLKSYPVYQLRQNFSKEINIAKQVEVVLPGLVGNQQQPLFSFKEHHSIISNLLLFSNQKPLLRKRLQS